MFPADGGIVNVNEFGAWPDDGRDKGDIIAPGLIHEDTFHRNVSTLFR